MRSTFCTAVVSAVLMAGVMSMIHSSPISAEQKAASPKVLRHVVLFKFKEGTSKDDLQKVEDAFRGLPSKINSITDFEWGTDVSPEGKSKGFTHCFFLTFKDDKGRDEYLPHPAHKNFGKIVGPLLADVCVVDYWTTK